MIFALLFGAPLIGVLLCYLLPHPHARYYRPYLLPVVASIQLVTSLLGIPSTSTLSSGWIAIDPLGALFLVGCNTLYLCCALYAPSYLHYRADRPNRVFCASSIGIMGILQLVFVAQHLGILWVAIEATTLLSGPLIFFNRRALSLEAAWKCLIICSVGIAIALLGTFFLAYAAIVQGIPSPSLLFADLLHQAPLLSKPWLHIATITLLVGYGTKMGIAPLHTWKPDAYGEAPGFAGALLAGAVTTGAFVAIIRVSMIVRASGEFDHLAPYLLYGGMFSVLYSAFFMVGQRDFKRMLAYSSVEHMGILLIGIGAGGLSIFASLFHFVNNALSKGLLFLSAGTIHRYYGSKSTDQVQGALVALPWSGTLFLIGLFAVTCSPPFAPFFSVFTLVQALFGTSHAALAYMLLGTMFITFLGMGTTVLAVTQGPPPTTLTGDSRPQETLGIIAPLLILLTLILILGIFQPSSVLQFITQAAQFVEQPT